MTSRTGSQSNDMLRRLALNNQEYQIYALAALENPALEKLPVSLKILLENLIRNLDGETVTEQDLQAFPAWLQAGGHSSAEIAYRPARILMQDFTGVPAVVDLAAMRDAMRRLGGDPERINPLIPVDLVIDHSVMVDEYGTPRALQVNTQREYQRNGERYQFLKWGQESFQNFRVVPPGTGICHQVNLEYLGNIVQQDTNQDGTRIAYPDTLIGTDSHTTMINSLAVLGWGVGGIEAEAAMLGQPVSMLLPEVIGFQFEGALQEGVTATDLVLTVTQMLRSQGVVGKFVEFTGSGLDQLPLADRATIANMAPEYGATCGFFPADGETIRYLRATGRSEADIQLVEAYAKANGLWRKPNMEITYTDTLKLDLADVEPCIAGPKRPQDRVILANAAESFGQALIQEFGNTTKPVAITDSRDHSLTHGDIVIAAITSCTNTSNPYVMIAAGLVARRARKYGLKTKPWVKTSFAPGSQVVSGYLQAAGLQEDLDALGFHLVGYGCTTCIGNSGPLPEKIQEAITENNLVVCSILSGNRNFEGRINPHVKANYLASPPLVVAYALAGSLHADITKDPLGEDSNGKSIYLRDLWPTQQEITEIVNRTVTRDAFQEKYANVFTGDQAWQEIQVQADKTYDWPEESTYIQHPPYFQGLSQEIPDPLTNIQEASILALLGDSVTTDHISPAGAISPNSPAGIYLQEQGVAIRDFNSYGSRRGNHEIMMRGTFANPRIRNKMVLGTLGGFTRLANQENILSIYDAAMQHREKHTPLVIIAGLEYGTGSSRDWAAKGTALLGVRAVIAQSFERIHRSNLVGMNVIPLEFPQGISHQSLELTGDEQVDIRDLTDLQPHQQVLATFTGSDGSTKDTNLLCRIDTDAEIEYLRYGGVLRYVLRQLAGEL